MGGGENPEKTTWHTHKQNLVCVTCDCKTDQLGSNLRRSVHCRGDGCCQSDIAFFNYSILSHVVLCCINLCCKDFCCIAGIYDGAYTDRQFLNIHIHAQYITYTFYVLNLPAFNM